MKSVELFEGCHMSRFRSWLLVCLGTTCGALSLAAEVAGCGGDDTSAPPLDASSDGTTFDVGGDVLPVETGGGDSTPGPEASTDAPLSDVQADVAEDSPTEGGNPEGGCTITVPAQGDFVLTAATLACQRLQQCCLVPAAKFNTPLCISTFSDPTIGGWQGSAYAAPYLDAGRIGYDMNAACQCLQQTAALNCGLVPAGTLMALENVCVSVLPGQSAVNSGCSASLECQYPAYCAQDAGGAACAPLVGADAGCIIQEQCSYAGLGGAGPAGNPSLFCDNPGTNKCIPRLADNSACMQNYQCAGNSCFFPATGPSTCVSAGTFSDPGVPGGNCDYFTITDAGAD
jgi:hypothetical protein